MHFKTLKRFVAFIISAVLFCFAFSYYGFKLATEPDKLTSQRTPADYDLEYEDVEFQTEDGLTLRGWFIPNENKEAKTILALHGYPASKGDILPVVKFLAADYHLFLFDFRYFGESDGEFSTAGGMEVRDLTAAITYLKEEKGIDEVGVWGFSMGGAVALMGAPDLPEIKMIISESSYASLSLMAYQLYEIPVLQYPLGWMTGIWGRLLLGFDMYEAVPMDSARELDIPILILHSKQDDQIPFVHGEMIQEALSENPQAEFWFPEEQGHGEFSEEDRDRIEKFLGDYFEG